MKIPKLKSDYELAIWLSRHKSKCKDYECLICSVMDCPHGDLIHNHHDGCPSCVLEKPCEGTDAALAVG